MNNNDIKRGIISGLNSIATPQSLTTQAINSIINSPYVKETIRGMLLDPVSRKIIPSIKIRGYRDVAIAIYALYKMSPDKVLSEILELPENERNMFITNLEKLNPLYAVFNIFPSTEDKPSNDLIKYKGTAIYIQYRFDDEHYIYYWNMYFVGLNAKSIIEEFNNRYQEASYDVKEGFHNKNKQRIPIYTFENGRRPKRGLCTVPSTIIVDHVQNEIDMIIKSVKLSEDISKTYELNKTTGILLYGPHGTGKSTLVRYLAMELGRSILLTSADSLMDVIDFVKDSSRDDESYIVLIEDIDFKFVDRRESKKDDKNTEMMANTDLLFQLLDGVLAESNLIVCATTNYIERLDPALIRDGRFDFRIEVTGLSYDVACKVCERFDVNPEDIKLSEWDTPISPASLQTFILKYKTTVS